jgi:type VI secretion system protein ImpG
VFNKYYQDELQFFRELGDEFAKAHPTAAHHLAGPGRDPDVERLLEGFAFMAGRIRQKLDDEFPELTHGLMNVLWPHYLRPVPSLAILELSPVLTALRQSQTVPRGAEVHSVPVEGTPCRFRTCYDVTLHPLSLEEVAHETVGSGASRLRMGFRLHQQAKPEALRLQRLRLFLHGDPAVSQALYFHLCRHVADARVVASNERGDLSREPWRPLRLEPAGFADDEALLPYPPASFPGYRHLQEYFSLPEKFLFLDVFGLERLAELSPGDRFQVEVRFDRALAPTLRPSREEVRLYCTPVVNLFPHEADPLRIDGSKTEYRLRPSGRDPFHYEVHTIDRVVAYAQGSAEEREIPYFYSFVRGGSEKQAASYFTRLRESVVDDRLDCYVSFVDGRGQPALPEAETVAFQLTCSNRRLAEALRVGDLQVPSDSSPAFVQFRNLTAPTASVAPPLGGDLQWRLVSHLSLNYVSLADVEALRGVLELYNFQALRDPRAARANQLRLEGLQRIHAEPSEALSRGFLLRGSAVTVDVLEDRFASDGDLYLFSTILNEFLSLHATLNSFTQLTVRGTQKGEETTWPCRIGRDLL